jgi:hypothetical protein
MPIALETITTKTYFIFGCIFICAAPFVWYFIPETKGLSLEVSLHSWSCRWKGYRADAFSFYYQQYIDRLFDSSKRTGAAHNDEVPTFNQSGMEDDKPVIQYLENAAEQKLAPVRE